jgi:TolA-binding protein
MSRSPKDERRTMPPLPAAGVRPLAHHEPAQEEGRRPDEPKGSPQAGLGAGPEAGAIANPPAGMAAPTSNPINMALLELQGEMDLPEDPPPPTEPGPAPVAASTSGQDGPTPPQATESPEARLASSQGEKPVTPEPAAVAAAGAATAAEPASAPRSGGLSSTPPIAGAGRLERPAARPPQAAVPAPRPAEGGPSLTTMLVGGAVVWFLFGLLGAWAYDHLVRKPGRPTESSSNSPSAETPSAPSAAELDPLKTRLGELGAQVDEFEKQLADAPKPTGSADLAPIRQRIDDVAKSVDSIDPLAKQVQSINSRMEGLETSINGLKGDLGSLQAQAAEPEKALAAAPAAAATTSNTPTPVPAAAEAEKNDPARLSLESPGVDERDGAFAQGVSLFKNGKYQDAYNFFEKLGATTPNDARVWYFAALSHGWAYNDWKEGGKTLSLVKKGIELEKAGTPRTSEIDSAIQELSPESGKLWLESKRKAGLK